MKKTVFYLVSILFTGFIASCGGNSNQKEAKASETKEEVNQEVKEEATQETATADFDLAASVKAGEAVYTGKGNCATCHMANGQGVAGTFPPLAGADYLKDNAKKIIEIVKKGLNETITVNGTEYKQVMPPSVGLTDEEVRDVVNYVLNSWDNNAGQVTLEDVQAVK